MEGPQAVTSLPKNAPMFVRATGFPASCGKSAHDLLLGPQKVAHSIDNLFEIGI
jgi:hypothetical protein